MSFASSLNLSTLSGTNGFRLDGVSANDLSGYSVASAGDVNGDGHADIIIGAYQADPNGVNNAGVSYVVFGKSGGWGGSLALSSLNGNNGFRLIGASATDQSGLSVASAGDLNGDGFADLLIGAPQADTSGISNGGATYVVLGKAGGFSATLALTSLSGPEGFRLGGVSANDQSGLSVASAGDVNGDGYGDLIVGAYQADPNGADSGASYIMFGKAVYGFTSRVSLTFAAGSMITISGVAAGNQSGYSVASAGDVNGDGFADVIIGAPQAGPVSAASGASYVVFGGADLAASSINLSSLNGSNGFSILGVSASDTSGYSVASAGDVNGDGFADIIVGAYQADPGGNASAGSSYVVFGRSGGWAASINLSALNGSSGFRLDGVAANDQSGRAVNAAGDLNGDGFADLIVGAWQADPNGADSGSSYVVFGKSGGWSSVINLSGLNGASGFRLDGVSAGDNSGVSVAAAGDVDGDGFGDVIIGAHQADPSGTASGSSYVYFSPVTGAATFRGTSLADLLRGTPDNDVMNGFGQNDRLFGNAGHDTINGGAGNDTIDGGAGNDSLDGGADIDTLSYASASTNVTISLALAGAQNTGGAGIDVFTGFENVTGGAGNDSLTGNAGDNVISGGARNDTVDGGDGNDTITGNEGQNVLTGGLGDDSINGGVDDDTIDGGTGNDTLSGGLGDDVLTGGAGIDTLSFAGETTNITVSLAQTVEQIITGRRDRITISGFENLTGGERNDSLTGDAGDNVLSGNAGNDTIDGGAGNDTIDGGSGGDTLSYASAMLGVTVSLAVTTPPVTGGAGTHTISNIEFLWGGAGNDSLTGDANSNDIDGGAGDDMLDGGAGIDTLIYERATVGVNVSLAVTTPQDTGGAGIDTIQNFENLTGGAGNDSLTGDDGANLILGGAGDDTVVGGAGNDTMDGGAGTDTLSFAASTAAIRFSLAIPAVALQTGGAGTDLAIGFENLIGGAGNDVLEGDGGTNTLIGGGGDDNLAALGGNDSIDGGDGNDTIDSGAGNDTIDGGAGIADLLTYETATVGVTVSLAITTAQATGGSGIDTISNFEQLLGSAFDDSLTGSALAGDIRGGDGNDTIEGGAGDDFLTGANGIDTVSYASAGGGVVVGLGGGIFVTQGAGLDTVLFFENLIGSAFNDTLTGSGGDNVIGAGGGDDRIVGGAGNDTVDGGAGNDTAGFSDTQASYRVGVRDSVVITNGPDGIDRFVNVENFQWDSAGAVSLDALQAASPGLVYAVLGDGTAAYVLPDAYTGPVAGIVNQQIGSAGNDALFGTDKADFINGGAGDDAIDGGAGNDVLDGGAGSNFLTGGAGVDQFFVEGRGAAYSNTWNTITDFTAGETVTIWGYQPGVSRFLWVASDGAPGYQGATLHSDLDGNGLIDTSVTFAALTQAQLPAPIYGTVGGNDYVFIG